MKLNLILSIYLLSFFLVTESAEAAEQYLAIGVVRDTTGAVIPGATVTVTGPGAVTVAATQTDDLGAFHLTLSQAGTFNLKSRQTAF